MTSARYVYAVVHRDTPLPPMEAYDLVSIPWGELAAVAGRPVEPGARAKLAAVAHHEAVVAAVRRHGPALPVRFGTLLPDDAAVRSALADRYDALESDLARIGDKVEMSLTALWAAPSFPDDADVTSAERARPARGAGGRYLRARAAEARRDAARQEAARALAAELDAALGAVPIERRILPLPTPRIALRAAYLLDRTGVDPLRTTIARFRAARGELRVLLTGPWAPYSFVSRPPAAAGGASQDGMASLARLLTDAVQERLG